MPTIVGSGARQDELPDGCNTTGIVRRGLHEHDTGRTNDEYDQSDQSSH